MVRNIIKKYQQHVYPLPQNMTLIYFNITVRLKEGDSSLRSERQAFRELTGKKGWLEAVPPTTPSLKTQVSVILSVTK
jgi:hypothetical protein